MQSYDRPTLLPDFFFSIVLDSENALKEIKDMLTESSTETL